MTSSETTSQFLNVEFGCFPINRAVNAVALFITLLCLPGSVLANSQPLVNVVSVKGLLGSQQADPKDAAGVAWSSPGYNDRSWPAALTTENNSIPDGRSKFWRIYVNVQPLPHGTKVKVIADGDDSLQVYLDGLSLGSWGNTSKGVTATAGRQTIDVSSNLTPGPHLFCVQVNNGPGNSKMEFRVEAIVPGSVADFTSNENLGSLQELAQGGELSKAVAQIDQAISKFPDEVKLYDAKMGLYMFYSFPPNYTAANATAEAARAKGLQPSTSNWKRAGLELGNVSRAIEMQKLHERKNLPNYGSTYAMFYSTLVKLSAGTDDLQVYAQRLRDLRQLEPRNAWIKIEMENAFLWVGQPEWTREIDQKVDGNQYTRMLYVRRILLPKGEYDKAQLFLAEAVRVNHPYADYELSQLTARMGDWAVAEPLLRSAVDKINNDVRAKIHHGYSLHAALVRVLIAQGKTMDARAASRLAPEVPDIDTASLWYLERYLWPRLQIALATGDSLPIKAATELLYKGVVARRGVLSGRNDMAPELLYDLMNGLLRSGHQGTAVALANDTLKVIADTPLPWHKAARAKAYQVQGKKAEAKSALAEAVTLAPKDFLIRKELEEVSKL